MINIILQRSLKYSFKAFLSVLKKVQYNNSLDHFYFGYGANLSFERLQSFNLQIKKLGIARLQNFEINFSLPTEYKMKGYASIDECKNSNVLGF